MTEKKMVSSLKKLVADYKKERKILYKILLDFSNMAIPF
jgi:hypothetical protein